MKIMNNSRWFSFLQPITHAFLYIQIKLRYVVAKKNISWKEPLKSLDHGLQKWRSGI